MKIGGKVCDIKVSTVYGSGTSTGYGVKVGRMRIHTPHGEVNCVFRGYTNYLGIRRGHRVRAVGEFTQDEETHDRVFRVREVSDLETGETWRFLERNLETFLWSWFIPFMIIAPIALLITGTLAPSATSLCLASVALSAIIAFIIAGTIEEKIMTSESYTKDQTGETPPAGNTCPACGATVPENLNVCIECAEPLTSCAICKTHIPPKEAIHCPHCHTPFHRDHLLEWLKIRGTCPNCGRPLNQRELHQTSTNE